MDDHRPEHPEQRLARYLAKEQEALVSAEKTTEPNLRETWLNVAQNWRFMAERVKRDYKL